MGLKFSVSGPVYNYDEDTRFVFKRISFPVLIAWEFENSVLKNRTKEEQLEFRERASEGVSNWKFYSTEEQMKLSIMPRNFCIEHIESVSGTLEGGEVEIGYNSFSENQKKVFWDEMLNIPSFEDWLAKYKACGEKKSEPVDEVG